MSTRHTTVAHVGDLIELIDESEADVRRNRFGHNLVEIWVANALAEFPKTLKLWPTDSVRTPSPAAQQKMTHIAQDTAVKELWKRHRIIYDLDPSLWSELADTDEDTVIPAGLMRRLPHPDPFISFPAPIVVPLDRPGESMAVTGFFVTGRRSDESGQGVCSTHHEKANGDLGLLFAAPVVNSQTGLPERPDLMTLDVIWTRVSLDVRQGDTTVAQLLAAIAPRFETMQTGAGLESVPPLVRAAVSALVYLCSANADVSQPERIARPPARRVMGGKAEVVGVGYHVGAAIRQAEEDVRRAGGSTVRVSGTGRASVRPHIRKAHFHRYRIGPGRREVTVKWLAPIPVNITPGGTTVPTVVPVR